MTAENEALRASVSPREVPASDDTSRSAASSDVLARPGMAAVPEAAIDAALAADAAWARETRVIIWIAVGREQARAMLEAAAPLIRADERERLLGAGPRDLIAVGAGPLLDPDCRDGKCGSCVGAPCEHSCHKTSIDKGGATA